MILIWDGCVFLVDLKTMFLHEMLSHLRLRAVRLLAARVDADLWPVLVWVGRGCTRGRVTVEGNVITLLQRVYETGFASKRANIHAHGEELEAVSEAVLRALAVCTVGLESFRT